MKQNILPSENKLIDVYRHLLLPATFVISELEDFGFRIDLKTLENMECGYLEKLQSIEDKVRSFPEVLQLEKETNTKFNLNSSEKLRTLLYDKLQLHKNNTKIPKTDKGKLSTNKHAIKILKGSHELVNLLEQHKKYSTLYTMFVKPMKSRLYSDGRLRANFLIHRTATGRLACTNPNLQQIPRNISSEEVGFDFDPELNIKLMFCSSGADWTLVEVDYSQMELRILAEYSEDEHMLEIFSSGGDIHLEVAKRIFRKDKVEDFERKIAKNINFGIIYGKSAQTLAEDLGVSEKEAEKFIRQHFQSMPKVEKFINTVQEFVLKNRYITSMFGRRREINFDLDRLDTVSEAFRKAVNTPIQSTASDYTLVSLINITDLLKKFKFKSRPVATIHDSIVFDVYNKELKSVVEIIRTVMENPQNSLIYWNRKVPFEVDMKGGERWGKMEKLT